MKLSTHNLPEYFTIATPANSHYKETNNCLNFIDRGSSKLFVTVGESWTYGSELPDRLKQVWGNLVSEHFEWDWLNLALPGGSNFFIADWVEELAKISSQLHYNKINVICLFTEIGRGFNSHHDMHIDYRGWLANNCYEIKDFYEFLKMLNKDCVDRILLANDEKISCYFGSNFIDHLGLPESLTLPSPWFRLQGISCDQKVYSGTTGVLRLEQITEFLSPDKLDLYKSWMSDMITSANLVDNICSKVGQGFTISHPSSQGHKIWADYTIKYLETHATV